MTLKGKSLMKHCQKKTRVCNDKKSISSDKLRQRSRFRELKPTVNAFCHCCDAVLTTLRQNGSVLSSMLFISLSPLKLMYSAPKSGKALIKNARGQKENIQHKYRCFPLSHYSSKHLNQTYHGLSDEYVEK